METTTNPPAPAPQAPPLDVAALARCAALALSPGRIAAVDAVLSAWIPAANELSRKMSDPACQALMPIVAFAHAHELPEEGGQ